MAGKPLPKKESFRGRGRPVARGRRPGQHDGMPPGSGTASGRVELRRSGQGAGAHWAYFDTNGRLIVEYYDHGAAALYESANLLIFDGEGQRALLGEAAQGGQAAMLAAVRARFASWWEVSQAAEASGIPCRRETDFLP